MHSEEVMDILVQLWVVAVRLLEEEAVWWISGSARAIKNNSTIVVPGRFRQIRATEQLLSAYPMG